MAESGARIAPSATVALRAFSRRYGNRSLQGFPKVLFELFNVLECVRRPCRRCTLLTVPHQCSISFLAVLAFVRVQASFHRTGVHLLFVSA